MKRVIKIIFWLAILGGFGYWSFLKLEKNKEQMKQETAFAEARNTVIPVTTDQVKNASWNGSYEVIGSFAPYKQTAVMSEASGKVIKLNFDNGSYVKEGATLLAIDNDLLQIRLKTLKTNLAKAENDFTRLNNLLGEGGVTRQQLDDAQLAIDNLKNEMEAVDKQISMTYVKAPIAGFISNKSIEMGSLVSPAMKIADITNVHKLKMQVYLTEDQVISVKSGQLVRLQADIFPELPLAGTISFIDVNAGAGKRYLVEMEVVNPDGQLKAGMTGTAFFGVEADTEMLSIPRESIVGNLQDAKVYVVADSVARLRSIETGIVFGDKVQVKKGLELGETIVVSGQINLEDGMSISIAAQ